MIILATLSIYANIGNIMALRGNAKVIHSYKTISAKSGMKLYQGDEINTGKKARVQVVLKDGTIVTIGEKSSFRFDKYFYDGSKKSHLKMKAKRGFFRSVTGKIGKVAPKRFTVETSSATIGVRGTDFSAMISKYRERYRCHRGAITIKIGDMIKLIGAGETFDFTPHAPSVPPKAIQAAGRKRFIPKATVLDQVIHIEHILKNKLPVKVPPKGLPCDPKLNH